MELLVHLPQECGTVGSVNHKREQPEWYASVCVCICSVYMLELQRYSVWTY